MSLGLVGQAAGLFAVTNIDDLLVLALFFAQGAGHRSTARNITAGFTSPPSKTFHLLGNGLLSKHLIRQVRRSGTLDELDRLRAEARSNGQAAGTVRPAP